MVLPLLGSFLGSALLPGLAAKTGMAFLANPIAAGAIGSGIGSLLQGDSFDEAIGTGLTSFFGGKLLGGLAGVPTSATAGSAASNAALEAGRKIPEGFTTLAKAAPKEGIFSSFGKEGLAEKLLVPKDQGFAKTLFDQGFGQAKTNLMPALQQGFQTAAANPLAAAGTAGGAMFADAANQQGGETARPPFKPRETVPIQQNINTPFAGYRPGGTQNLTTGSATPPQQNYKHST